MRLQLGCLVLAYLSMVSSMSAQTAGASVATTTATTQNAAQNALPATQVPRLVKFSGTVQNFNADEAGAGAGAGNNASAASTVVGMTFSLYGQQTGGVPLWSEVQNVQVDSTGHYTVQLGSTQPDGLPVELFSSAQAQWLGVRQEGQAEQPRIMLLSVPYALKAADAETFGGKPPSAFMPAPGSAAGTGGSATTQATNGKQLAPSFVGGSGTPNYLARWTSSSNLSISSIYEASSDGFIGIGTTEPEGVLTVAGNFDTPMILAFQLNGASVAVQGQAEPNGNRGGTGVLGHASAYENGNGVEGETESHNGIGVWGIASSQATGASYGVLGQASGPTAYGVYGKSLSATGQNYGVYGLTASPTGYAIAGENDATSGQAVGVIAQTLSDEGDAIFGVGVARSNETASVTLRPVGVWGDTGDDSGAGVVATADNGVAFAGYNNAGNIATAKFENDENTDEFGNILATHNPNYGGICLIDSSGDIDCTGTISGGFLVNGGTRRVALYAVQAPENWFEDAGSGQLVNGVAVVPLESVFTQTVNTGVDYHVFLTPNGDCKGLYVSNKKADSFEVHELGGGTANVGFDYRIMARRKGYETVRLADKTKQFEQAVNEPRPRPGNVAQPTIPKLRSLATGAGVANEK